MKVIQHRLVDGVWQPALPVVPNAAPQLVLCFGQPERLFEGDPADTLKCAYPAARLAGCGTAGEIMGTEVTDDTVVATVIQFENTRLVTQLAHLESPDSSYNVGRHLASELAADDLRHVLVLSDGLLVNGSELVRGLMGSLPESVLITGGLAGDGSRFQQAQAWLDAPPHSGQVIAIGLYGSDLRIGHGSLGGWSPFGPDRIVTRSSGNLLFELDGKSALSLYKEYLGEYAQDLPASGLLFPLEIQFPDGGSGLVRTLLAIDADADSMTFAGDIPEGSTVRLMRAHFDRLIEGAEVAAEHCLEKQADPEFALLISCVGRKMVLEQRVEEEVEAVREVLGANTALAGFYSYGEISPLASSGTCELHNQTMTITTFKEV